MALEEWLRDATPLATIRDFIRFGATKMSYANVYFGHGTDNAWDEACFLVLESLNIPWSLIDQVLDAKLSSSEQEHMLNLFDIRINERIPSAYLVGKAWFAQLPFIVTDKVLIPRSPVAEMIENQFAPWLDQPPLRVLDLCTGSGCIGIATALQFPDAIVDLSDISPEAIDVAWQNIDLHGLEGRVQALESDLFSELKDAKYDLIVCNPPYVNAEDLATMPREYQHEPSQALGSGDDGLNFTRRLLAEAREHLSDNGLLVCEVGNSWFSLETAFSDIAFTWVDFQRGGHGVFVMTAAELDALEGLDLIEDDSATEHQYAEIIERDYSEQEQETPEAPKIEQSEQEHPEEIQLEEVQLDTEQLAEDQLEEIPPEIKKHNTKNQVQEDRIHKDSVVARVTLKEAIKKMV